MSFAYSIIDEIIVFKVTNNFDVNLTDEAVPVVSDLIRQGNYKFIYDLTDVNFIDSCGIGVIITGVSSAIRNNKRIKIVGAKQQVKNSFELMSLDQLVDFMDDLDKAIQELK